MTLPAKPSSAPASGAERAWAFEALASIADGVVIADAEARLVYANPAGRRMVGLSDLGPEPSTWADRFGIFCPDGATPMPATDIPLVAALRGETVRERALFVKNHHRPDGVHLLCSASPLADASGTIRGAVVIFHDVTAQRLRETQLFEGERQKKAILDNIPDMAWLKDRDGRYLSANRQLAAAARVDDPVGLTDFDLWPQDLAARYRADDQEVMRTGLHKTIVEPFVTAGGDRIWIETVKTRIVGDRGEVLGTTGIARDITKRLETEEALRTLADELEHRVQERTVALEAAQEALVRKERLAALGQLAGGVAHQIRNPLAAIMNASYVLKRHLSPDQHPNVDDAIRIIHDEVRHANVIITSLLDFARVRAPDRQPVAIVEVLDKVLAGETLPPGVTVERVVEEVPLLELDVNQMHGALYNLVRNALESMNEEGVLRVEVKRVPNGVLLAVSDTGPGISPQVRGHLFEPLHSTKPAGIGLGLVTARTFIESHGGRVTSVDVPRGARFEVFLPAP